METFMWRGTGKGHLDLIEKGVVYLDVQVIGSQDELKESSLIYLRKESSLGDLEKLWEL